jgi:mRNA-degrading endonuclease RelE of RelBE toxin-antitoxin system
VTDEAQEQEQSGDPELDQSHAVLLTGEALRSLAKLPARIAEPLVVFAFSGLAAAPRRRGKPLAAEFSGFWSARRGDFRVIYSIDDARREVTVHRIAGRSDAYRSR